MNIEWGKCSIHTCSDGSRYPHSEQDDCDEWEHYRTITFEDVFAPSDDWREVYGPMTRGFDTEEEFLR